jgi:hypothetical protein
VEEQLLPRRLFFFLQLPDGLKRSGGLFPAIELLQRLGEMKMSLHQIGTQLRRLLQLRHGIRGPALLQEPFAKQRMRRRKTGVASEGLAQIGINAGKVLSLLGGREEIPRAMIVGSRLAKALGQCREFGKPSALQQNGRQSVIGQGMRKARGKVRLGVVPALQFLQSKAAAEAEQKRLRKQLPGFRKHLQRRFRRMAGKKDGPQLNMGGFRTGVERQRLLGLLHGRGGVAQTVGDLGGQQMPAGSAARQLRQLLLRVGVAALGHELLDSGPIHHRQQQDQEHRLYSSTAMCRVLLLMMLGAEAWGAPGYAGSAACQRCHPAIAARQEASHHAGALRPMAATDWPERLAETDLRERSGIAYRYTRAQEGLRVTITHGARSLEALLEWAFGSGAQAMTPVGRHNGAYHEHRISYYRATDHPGRTIGHAGTPAKDPLAAFGVRQDGATISRCFGCHATNVEPGPDLRAMEAGVRCERCHGPGQAHVSRPSPNNIRRTQSMELCAECHRQQQATGSAPEVRDPASVRFQPVGLSVSRCFTASGTMTCVTCHDPHDNARRDAKHYQAVCEGCHRAPPAAGAACRRAQGENCLRCHMRATSPLPHLRFTDHRIRVY